MSSPDHLVGEHWAADASPTSHLILPDGCVDVIERGEGLVVVGPMSRARWVRVAGGSIRGMRLNPGSASWLGVPLSELRDQIVPLSELVVPGVHHHALSGVEQHARARVRRDARVLRVTRRLLAAPSSRVEVLAAEVGWTPRHLRRRFEAEIGLSPRRFARVARLQRLVAGLAGPSPLGTLAHAVGFSDQAHLCRDVRDLTGLSPSALRRVLQG